MPEEKQISPMMMKVVTGLFATAITASFGWIIKIESHMTQVKADIEDIEDDLADLEKDVADAREGNLNNKIDLTTVQGIVKSIEGKVDDIRRSLERIASR